MTTEEAIDEIQDCIDKGVFIDRVPAKVLLRHVRYNLNKPKVEPMTFLRAFKLSLGVFLAAFVAAVFILGGFFLVVL